MGYSNGQLESEVKGGKGEKGDPGLPGIGFKLTDDGDFDIDNKRLTDLAEPIDTSDAATKSYVDNHLGSGPDSDNQVKLMLTVKIKGKILQSTIKQARVILMTN